MNSNEITKIIRLNKINSFFSENETNVTDFFNSFITKNDGFDTKRNLINGLLPLSSEAVKRIENFGVMNTGVELSLSSGSNYVFTSIPNFDFFSSFKSYKAAIPEIEKRGKKDWVAFTKMGSNQYGISYVNFKIAKDKEEEFAKAFNILKNNGKNTEQYQEALRMYYNSFEISNVRTTKESFLVPDTELLVTGRNAINEKIQSYGPDGIIRYYNADYDEISSRFYQYNLSLANESSFVDKELLKISVNKNKQTMPDSVFKSIATTEEMAGHMGIMNRSIINDVTDNMFISYKDFSLATGFGAHIDDDKYKNYFVQTVFNHGSKDIDTVKVFNGNSRFDKNLTNEINKLIKTDPNFNVEKSLIAEKHNYHMSRFRHIVNNSELENYNTEILSISKETDKATKAKRAIELSEKIINEQRVKMLDSYGVGDLVGSHSTDKDYVNKFYEFYEVQKKNGKLTGELKELKELLDDNLHQGVLIGQIGSGFQFDNYLSVGKQSAVITDKVRNVSQSILTPLAHTNTDSQRKAQVQDYYSKLTITTPDGKILDTSELSKGFFSPIDEMEYKKIKFNYLQGQEYIEQATQHLQEKAPKLYSTQSVVLYTNSDTAWQDSNMFTKTFAMQNLSQKDNKKPLLVKYNTLKTAVFNGNDVSYTEDDVKDFFKHIYSQTKNSKDAISVDKLIFEPGSKFAIMKDNLIKNMLSQGAYQSYQNAHNYDIESDFINIGSGFKNIHKIEGNETAYIDASNEMARKFNLFTEKYFVKADATSSINILNSSMIGSGQNFKVKGSNYAYLSDIKFGNNGIEVLTNQILTQSEGSKVLIDNVKATTQSLPDLLYLNLPNNKKLFLDGVINEKMSKGSRGFSGTFFTRNLTTMAYRAITSPLADGSDINHDGTINYKKRFDNWKAVMNQSIPIDDVQSNGKKLLGSSSVFDLFNIDLNLTDDLTLEFTDKNVESALKTFNVENGQSLEKTIVRNMNEHLRQVLGRKAEVNDSEAAFLGNYVTDLMFSNQEEFVKQLNPDYQDQARVIIKNADLYKSYGKDLTTKVNNTGDKYSFLWIVNTNMMSESKKRADKEALKIGRLSSIVAKEYGFDDIVDLIKNKGIAKTEEFLADYLTLAADKNTEFSRGGELFNSKFSKTVIDLSSEELNLDQYGLSSNYQTYISNSVIGKHLDFDFEKERLVKPLYGQLSNLNSSLLSDLENIFYIKDNTDLKNINNVLGRFALNNIIEHDFSSDKKLSDIMRYVNKYSADIDYSNKGIGFLQMSQFTEDSKGPRDILKNYLIHAQYYLTKEASKQAENTVMELANKYGVEFNDIYSILNKYDTYNNEVSVTFANKLIPQAKGRLNSTIVNKIKNFYEHKQASKFFSTKLYNKDKLVTSSDEIFKYFSNFGLGYLEELHNNNPDNEFINKIFSTSILNNDGLNFRQRMSKFTLKKNEIKNIIDFNLPNFLATQKYNPDYKSISTIISLMLDPKLFSNENYFNFSELSEISKYGNIPFIIDQLSIDDNNQIVSNKNLTNLEKIIRTNDELNKLTKERDLIAGNSPDSILYKIQAKEEEVFEQIKKIKGNGNADAMKSTAKRLAPFFVDAEDEISSKLLKYMVLNGTFEKQKGSKQMFRNTKIGQTAGTAILQSIQQLIENSENVSANMLGFNNMNDYLISEPTRKLLSTYVHNSDEHSILDIFSDIDKFRKQLGDSDDDQMLYKELERVSKNLEEKMSESLRPIISSVKQQFQSIYSSSNTTENLLEIIDDIEDKIYLNAGDDYNFYNKIMATLSGSKYGNEYLSTLENRITQTKGKLINIVTGRYNDLVDELFSKGGRISEFTSLKVKNSAAISPREGSVITSFIKEEMLDLISKKQSQKYTMEQLNPQYKKLLSDLNLIYGKELSQDAISSFKDLYYAKNITNDFLINSLNEIKNKLDSYSHIIVGSEEEYQKLGKIEMFDNKFLNKKKKAHYGILSRHPHQYKSSLTPVRYVMFDNNDLSSGFISRFYNNGINMPGTQTSLSFIGKNTALSAKGDFDGDVFQIMFLGDRDLNFNKYTKITKKEFLNTFNQKTYLFNLLNNLTGENLEEIFSNESNFTLDQRNHNLKYISLKKQIETLFNNGEQLTGAEAYKKIEFDFLNLTNERTRVLEMLADEVEDHALSPSVLGKINNDNFSIEKRFLSYFMLNLNDADRANFNFNPENFEFHLNNLPSNIKTKFENILSETGGREFLLSSINKLKSDKEIITWNLLLNSSNKYLNYAGIAKTGSVHNALTNVREFYSSMLNPKEYNRLLSYMEKFDISSSIISKDNIEQQLYILKKAGMNNDIGTLIEALAVSAKKGSVDPNKKLNAFADASTAFFKTDLNYDIAKASSIIENASKANARHGISDLKNLSEYADADKLFKDWFFDLYKDTQNKAGDLAALLYNFGIISDSNIDLSNMELLKTATVRDVLGKKGKLTDNNLTKILSTWSMLMFKSEVQRDLKITELNRNEYNELIGKTHGANFWKRMHTMYDRITGKNTFGTRSESSNVIESSIDTVKELIKNAEQSTETIELKNKEINNAISDIEKNIVKTKNTINSTNDISEEIIDNITDAEKNITETKPIVNNVNETIKEVKELKQEVNNINKNINETKTIIEESNAIIQNTSSANTPETIITHHINKPVTISEDLKEFEQAKLFNIENPQSAVKPNVVESITDPVTIAKVENQMQFSFQSIESTVKADEISEITNETVEHTNVTQEVNKVTKVETHSPSNIPDNPIPANSQNEIIQKYETVSEISNNTQEIDNPAEKIVKATMNNNATHVQAEIEENSNLNKTIDNIEEAVSKIKNKFESAKAETEKLNETIKRLSEENATLQQTVQNLKNQQKASKFAGDYINRVKDDIKIKTKTITNNPNVAKYKNKALLGLGIGALAMFFRIFQKNRSVVNLDINEDEYERSQGSIYRNLGQYNMNTNIRSLY